VRRENAETFSKQWNGVFFVINGRTEAAQSHFNQTTDIARAQKGRFYAQAEPLDLAGLALTGPLNLPLPLPREF
jgi:hypothetical protein